MEDEFLLENDYNSIQKLDKLHELILQSKKLFTESQLELWNCMYQCMPIEQIVNVLGKDKSTVYSLRNKLRSKIRANFSLEMIST